MAVHTAHRTIPRQGMKHMAEPYSQRAGHKEEGEKDSMEPLCGWEQLESALRCASTAQPFGMDLYVTLLKACAKTKDLVPVKIAYADIIYHKPELFELVGNHLILTLVKCGAIDDAYHAFLALPDRSVFSWSAVIWAYTEIGRCQEALEMHYGMLEEGIVPNHYTFVSLVKACASILDLYEGEKLHAAIVMKGFSSNLFIANTLVSMYGKCGCILEAEYLFNGLFHRNVVSWNAMLSAYTEQNQVQKVLKLYRQLEEEAVYGNQQTFVISLQACSALIEDGGATKEIILEMGQALHAQACRKGFCTDVFICNTLVSMYGKCGSILKSERVFHGMPEPGVITWTALLSAYVEVGLETKALQLYKQMQQEGVSSNEQTFVVILQACIALMEKKGLVVGEELQPIKMKVLEIGKALDVDAKRQDFASNVFLGSTLLSMYGKSGRIVEAETVFNSLLQRNTVAWNAMLSVYLELAQEEKVLRMYRQMHEEGVDSTQQTFVITLHACNALVNKNDAVNEEWHSTRLLYLEIGQALHGEVRRKCYTGDAFIGSTLIRLYGKCGSIFPAENVFDGLLHYDHVSWSALLSAYVDQNQGEKALQIYRKMQEEGFDSNQQTFVIVLQACALLVEKEETSGSELVSAAVLEFVNALRADVERNGFGSDLFISSTLMKLYGNFGSTMEAEDAFNRLSQHDAVYWSSTLSAYVEQGQGEKALLLFRQILETSVALDDVMVLCVLQACSLAGDVDVCRQLHFAITSMDYLNLSLGNTFIRVYGSCGSMIDAQSAFDLLPQPDVVSWNACIAGYAQAGNINATLQKFQEMLTASMTPDRVTFLSLLSACSHSSLVDEGIWYFETMSTVFGLSPASHHYVIIIDLLGRAGNFWTLEKILLEMPVHTDLALWLRLLGACYNHGNVRLGKQAFDNAVALNPKEGAAYVMMSNIYANAGLQEHVVQLQCMRHKVIGDQSTVDQ